MNLTKAEQQFVSHIRTLHLKRKSTRKDQIIDFVFLSLKTIRANYFSNESEVVFDKLKSVKEIDYEKITRVNGGYFFKFKALKDGPIDFSLLKEHARKWDILERMVKANLRWVSLEPGVDSTIYFQNFLTQKEKHLDAFFLVDNFSGRIHTPITSLKGSIREHLLLKKENVVSLDVAQRKALLAAFERPPVAVIPDLTADALRVRVFVGKQSNITAAYVKKMQQPLLGELVRCFQEIEKNEVNSKGYFSLNGKICLIT